MKPEGQPHQIPSTQKKHRREDKVRGPVVRETGTDDAEAQHHASIRQKIAKVGACLRRFWAFVREIPSNVWNYFREMFLNEKSAFWTMVFTGLLVIVTLMLVNVTDKVDETTRATQRAYISFQGVRAGAKILSADQKQWVTAQMIPT